MIRLCCIYFQNTFALILNSNLHDLNETNAVFSRFAMVLFLCRNQSSQNWSELFEDFLIEYMRNYGAKTHCRGGPMWPHGTWARLPGACPRAVWGLGGPPPPTLTPSL